VHARQKVIEELERQAQDRSESQKITGKGRKLLDKGEIAQAEKMFAQALKLNPENHEARAGLAEVDEIRQKQLAAARRAQAGKEVTRGEALLAQGKLNQAEEAFSKALELTPELPAAQKGLDASRGQRRGIALLERAEKAARSGQFDQAEQWLQKAAAYPAVSARAKRRLAGLGTRRRAWRQEQAKKEAREQARQARATGIADFKAGRWESAVNNLRKYLAEFPDDRSVSELLSQASKVHASYQVGALEVHSTPSARVYLDGRYVGITPLQMDKVPKGGHRVEVRIVGYKSQSRELFIKGSAVNGVSFTLVPEVNPPGGADKKD
jgi:tetratricopeptide (TPR) repeat protein